MKTKNILSEIPVKKSWAGEKCIKDKVCCVWREGENVIIKQLFEDTDLSLYFIYKEHLYKGIFYDILGWKMIGSSFDLKRALKALEDLKTQREIFDTECIGW